MRATDERKAGSRMHAKRLSPGSPLRWPPSDPDCVERRRQRRLVELRVPLRTGVAPHIDERPRTCFVHHRHELVHRAAPVSDRKDGFPMHRIRDFLVETLRERSAWQEP
jgi:hypothetical protein